ncbi:MAG: DUF1501 domain-containing protein [Casimicrobiaceae bacterium]
MNTNRRKFLTSTSALTAGALATNLSSWGIQSANAQAATGYKAVVCVFLFGGNDSNNMVLPFTDYTAYQTVRTAASNVGIPQAQLLQFNAASQGKSFGFHPNLLPISPLYASGKLAVLANTGTLVRPLTKAQYQANLGRPSNLFSHSDQQSMWQGLINGAAIRSGWAGRMADKLVAANGGQLVPTSISVSGQQVFTLGTTTAPLVIPQNGGVAVSGQGTDAVSVARFNALNTLLASADPTNEVVKGGAAVMTKALTANATANPLLALTDPKITTAFSPGGTLLNTGLAQQLRQVARLIEGRAVTGVKRQFFFVSMGGYDTHSNTITNQNNLFNQLAPAMRAFYDYTVAAGIANDVTQFTMSDFNRTFIGNANQGVDHAWGGHHLVLGGAVRGGDMYGTFPDLVVNGNQDSGRNGSWIPTTGVDQVGGTIGKWLGMPGTDIAQVFPNLANFSTTDLGFMV